MCARAHATWMLAHEPTKVSHRSHRLPWQNMYTYITSELPALVADAVAGVCA